MPAPLLATKTLIPPVAKSSVARPHLCDKLTEGLQPGLRLILVDAPAGFGKTTLVTSWAANLRAAKLPSAPLITWLSLDEGDNDAVSFWSYVIAALQTQLPGMGQQALALLQAPQSPDPKAAAAVLVNELAQTPNSLVLILDDYHLIRTASIHQALTFLIERMPPHAHVVITTRIDPPLPLALLRGRGQLLEIRLADLRFSDEDAYLLLSQGLACEVSQSSAARLNAKAEGWAAGLQMAGTSLRGRTDTEAFIQNFSGSSRYIMDYLVEEVLARQTPEVQDFLLTTSILDSLSGPLCDCLRATSRVDRPPAPAAGNSQALLQQLEASNLFVIPLDEDRYWYRYHRLFADLLRKRLLQAAPARALELQCWASHWFEENGLTNQAVEHAFQAQDFERAGRLVDAAAEALWLRGEHGRLLKWLRALPEQQLAARPALLVVKACLLAFNGSLQEAEQCLQDLDQHLPSAALEPAVRTRLVGRAATVRALAAEYRGEASGIVRYASLALEALSTESDLSWRVVALISLGHRDLTGGDFAACRRHLIQAVEAGKSAGCFFIILEAMTKLTLALWLAGRLKEAGEVCQDGLQYIEENHLDRVPATCLLCLSWGFILLEQNRLEEAGRFISRGADLSRDGDDLVALAWAYHELAMVSLAHGDVEAAESANHKAGRFAQEHELPNWLVCAVAAFRAQILVRSGRLAEAEQYLADRNTVLAGTVEHPHQAEYEALVNVLVAKGEFSPAAELLERSIAVAQADRQEIWLISYQAQLCLVYQALGDLPRALQVLESALSLAEPEGIIRVFVEKGASMARLLHEVARQQGAHSEFSGRLLAAFPRSDAPQGPTSTMPPGKQALIEPLRGRELEIIQLVADGLSNKEIAQRLHISLRTVKYHTTSIYGKLGVSSRTQALAAARALGIIGGA